MQLLPLVGHQPVRDDLIRAVRRGNLPQVLLITGPDGVGKQRLALWLGQVVLCDHPDEAPCGRCAACRQVLGLVHPDLHWFVPMPRPKGGDATRQIDEVAEALEGVMAARRETALWGAPDGMESHGIASARLLQRQAAMTSVAGGWRVFLIGHADRLVPQESSPEAANALLKLLEEPPARTLIVLTAAEPGMVLTTIRSRTTPIRLGRLADADVREFLAQAAPTLASEAVIRQAHGSIGAAITGAATGETRARTAAKSLLDGLDGGAALVERVLRQGPWQARGEFTDLLDALAGELAERARRAANAGDRVSSSEVTRALNGVTSVLAARERAQGNVNPQLLLAVLVENLAALEAA